MRQGMSSIVGTSKGVVLAQKLYNPKCESDDFLSVVLIQRGKSDFVTWVHNAQVGSFFEGNYESSQEAAWDTFNLRGRF